MTLLRRAALALVLWVVLVIPTAFGAADAGRARDLSAATVTAAEPLAPD